MISKQLLIKIQSIRSTRSVFVWTGVSLGLIFSLILLLVDAYQNKLEISVTTIIQLYRQDLILLISFFVPLLLTIGGYVISKAYRLREQTLQQEKAEAEQQMDQLQTFVENIAKGNFTNTEYVFKNVELSALLMSIREKLVDQKEEDERSRWVAEGHARFGEVLRQADDLEALAYEVIKNLVRYVGLNQGAVFIHHKDEQQNEQLMQSACYAYDRKKFIKKSLTVGEGLVGQCFLENETIILKKVPQDYIRITSGLGQATPHFVIIVPIKVNDVREGVIELAGFKSIEDYQIKFIEKVCEGFASVLRTTKVNNETRALLNATQAQAEQLRSQEEEIRQNLEEMQATQEQLNRQLDESRVLAERVGRREMVMALTTILSETDLNGTITFANDKFCEVSKYTRNELIGKPQNIVRHSDMPKELFKLFWDTIRKGEVFKGIVKNKAKDGSHYWVDATIVPIKNAEGEVIKYVGSRYHIEDDKLATALYEKQAEKFGWLVLH
jgi:PAS domain S-box-containing protein